MLKKEEIFALFDSFTQKKILVIGDVMLDSYWYGKVQRISPEAPVPIVEANKREFRLGGAANVAINLKSLDATPYLCSIVGKDIPGEEFISLLKKEQIDTTHIVRSMERPTTVKHRVIGNGSQMLRVDEESTANLSSEEEALFLEQVENVFAQHAIDALIFEDYDKGLLSSKSIEFITSLACKKQVPICVDPKKNNFKNYFNVSLFKPNLKELKEGLKMDVDIHDKVKLQQALKLLQQEIGCEIILLTLSEYGVVVYHDSCMVTIAAHPRRISDVSGAGDTVISVAALCLSNQISPLQASYIANLAGGLVCEFSGVVSINKESLLDELLRNC